MHRCTQADLHNKMEVPEKAAVSKAAVKVGILASFKNLIQHQKIVQIDQK
jgi:hypothetical protein